MAEVTLQDGETVESALRRFKRKVLQENIIGEPRAALLTANLPRSVAGMSG